MDDLFAPPPSNLPPLRRVINPLPLPRPRPRRVPMPRPLPLPQPKPAPQQQVTLKPYVGCFVLFGSLDLMRCFSISASRFSFPCVLRPVSVNELGAMFVFHPIFPSGWVAYDDQPQPKPAAAASSGSSGGASGGEAVSGKLSEGKGSEPNPDLLRKGVNLIVLADASASMTGSQVRLRFVRVGLGVACLVFSII
jgi:hypothetical protein